MRLNLFETLIVNNPARDVLLRQTVDFLFEASGSPALDHVLEVGCGRGSGIGEIARRFRPSAIDAFDLDEAQVALARRRLQEVGGSGAPVKLWAGDTERIAADDERYDAVFEFAILHHVPNWRGALSEIRRVLKPGGLFLFEELSSEFFEDLPVVSALLRRFTDHPWETMFDHRAFRRGLEDAGFEVRAMRANVVPGWHRGVAARA
ncbi:MAG TPA: class I SAM-dependent methyltransferase [Polyangiaceae bacterium]|jgi:ubiquinone/menaquinone biosynthesis C-methylase UbiE|nr:class I SAM-dependent methyltransferase [Polyangiaceae bacterium]